MLNVNEESWQYQFLVFDLTQAGIEPEPIIAVAVPLLHLIAINCF